MLYCQNRRNSALADMNIVWLLLLTLLYCKANAFKMSARSAEWDDEYRYGDPVKKILKRYSRGGSITKVEDDALHFDKREVILDRTFRRSGVRIEADAYIRKYGNSYLGECTKGKHTRHKYTGEEKHTPFHRVSYNYFHQSGRLRSRQFTDVMGGVGVSAFGGLFGASVKARVVTSVKRDSRSLLIYSHFVIHKGMISLVNPHVGENREDCENIAEHYYLRDILTGLDDYLMVQLHFSSEAKRKEIEVKIKVKILFFSITKTIRRIQTSLKTEFTLKIYHIKTYPKRQETTHEFSGVEQLERGIKLVEEYEKSRAQLLRDIKAAKYNDQNLHLEYFFVPCLITTVAETVRITRANTFTVTELIERINELESVLQDTKSIEIELNDARKTKLVDFENDITSRLNQMKKWRDRSKLYQNDVMKLLELYGEDRAPYYYERKLRKILGGD